MIKIQGKTVLVTFQYERLPRICFDCGVIRHGAAGCLKRNGPRSYGGKPQYGPWMRVSSPKKHIERRYGRFGGYEQGEWNSQYRGNSSEGGSWRGNGGRSGEGGGGGGGAVGLGKEDGRAKGKAENGYFRKFRDVTPNYGQ